MRILFRTKCDSELVVVEACSLYRTTDENKRICSVRIIDVNDNWYECDNIELLNRFSNKYESYIKELYTTGLLDLSEYLFDEIDDNDEEEGDVNE